MPLAIPLALASSLPSIIAGIVAKRQHNQYASLLAGEAKELPTGIEAGEDIFRELASKGMPGFEVAKESLRSTMSTYMEKMKEVIDSPAGLVGALAEGQAGVTDKLQELNIRNEEARIANQKQYASYLSGPYAGAQQIQTQMKLGVKEQEMMGTSEFWSGLTQGVGGAMQGYGTGMFMDYAKDNPSAWSQFMGGDEDILDKPPV